MTTGHYIYIMKRKIHREDILSAGRELMFLHGYSATAIKDITNKVDIPKGSFYNHFATKEEFALEMLEGYVNNGIAHFTKVLSNKTQGPIKRIEQLFDEMIRHSTEVHKCKLGCFLSNFSAELGDVNENFRYKLEEGFNTLEGLLQKCLEEAKQDKDLNSKLHVESTAGFIINSWHGALVRMKATASAKPLEDFKNMLNYILQD